MLADPEYPARIAFVLLNRAISAFVDVRIFVAHYLILRNMLRRNIIYWIPTRNRCSCSPKATSYWHISKSQQKQMT